MSDHSISPKTHAAQVIGGGRHYSGRGLGPEPPWHCPGCGREHHTPIAQGCADCLAEAVAQQSARAQEAARTMHTPPRNQTTPPRPPVGSPVRRALPAFVEQTKTMTDFETILRRVLDEYAGRGVQISIVNDHIGVPTASIDATAAARPIDPDDHRSSRDLYAEYLGLQMIVVQVQAGGVDPLLPTLDTMVRRIEAIEALPRMQEYFLTDPSAVAADPAHTTHTTPDNPMPHTTQENPK